MKIGLVLYPIQDLGGIISHVENLASGLKELGHEVGFHILYWQRTFFNSSSDKEILKQKGWTYGNFCAVHQMNGWNAKPYEHKLSYLGEENLEYTKEILSQYDLIIWEVPVPSKSKNNEGNHRWTELYDVCPKNIAIVHDGNLFNIPWICEIKEKLVGIACVHECAFNLAKSLDIPRALILNPQNLIGLENVYDYHKREQGFLSVQIFKGWKRADDLIRSIPYLSKGIRKVLAGGGIEQRYMVSKDKVKEKYLCRRVDDPDLPIHFENNRVKIWNRALWNGMEWNGIISPFRRDIFLRTLRTSVDPSWSLRYSKHGSHFNRVTVEAMMQGNIPLATNLGMSNNLEGNGLLFKPNENYIMIPYDFSPKDYAGIIEYANNLETDFALKIIENNYELLTNFDRRQVAQDFINLSEKRGCGFLGKRFQGKLDENLKTASDEIMANFFGSGKFKG